MTEDERSTGSPDPDFLTEPIVRATWESLTDGVVVHDVAGGVLLLNPAAERILGLDADGSLPRSIIDPRWRQVRPDGSPLEPSAHPVVVALETRQPVRGKVVGLHRPDGTMAWLEVNAEPVCPPATGAAVVCCFRDVTEEVALRDALVSSQERYRVLAENAADFVIQIGEDLTIEWVSPSITRAIGWRPEDMVGTPVSRWVPPHDMDPTRVVLEAVLSGETVVTRRRIPRATGGLVWVDRTITPIRDADGRVISTLAGYRVVQAEVEAQEELAYRAFHDPLTGLRNRAWILDMLDTELRESQRSGEQVGVLFVDLDNFKVINDSLGHLAGDEVLATIAQRITAKLRPRDGVGRFGGDEFVIVAPSVHGTEELEAIARRVSAAISVDLWVLHHRIVPSSSIGLAISQPSSTSATLLRDADAALFRAKASGRSQWQLFDDEMHAQAVTRLTTEGELRRGIDNEEFVTYYQPIVRLSDGTVVGQEALVRWQHPTRGLLSPAEFLPVAEDSGLIVDLGAQVLDQICRLITTRPDITCPISVNKSPVQIGRPGWHDRFVARLRSHDVDPRRVVIEITETAVPSVLNIRRDDLVHLRDLGVGIHVDDFGTGYSSIALLRELPVSGLKLDMSFTRHLLTDTTAAVLAAGLAGLARGLHLVSVAEGIETPEQLAVLRGQGWTHGQGYLFGRPSPEPVMEAAYAVPELGSGRATRVVGADRA